MQLLSKRFEYSESYTISKLYIDGVYECFVLEDLVRAPGVKVKQETAIPAGTYPLVLDFSPKYKKIMPHILNVPNFVGIRIHSGNTKEDTEGCLLVGTTWAGGDSIGNSRVAFSRLFDKLLKASTAKEEIWITIEA